MSCRRRSTPSSIGIAARRVRVSQPGQHVARDRLGIDRRGQRTSPTKWRLMNRIAPDKRVRGNLEKWASSTISLRGGQIENSAAHPDAHKVWTFGNYRQRLTDAVNFSNIGAAPTTIRLDQRHRSAHVHGRGGRQRRALGDQLGPPGASHWRTQRCWMHSRVAVRLPGRCHPGLADCPKRLDG